MEGSNNIVKLGCYNSASFEICRDFEYLQVKDLGYKIIASQEIVHANFHPHDNGHVTVYPSSMRISSQSVPHVDLSILIVIQLFRSVSSCPYRKDSLFVDTNLQQGFVPQNELATLVKCLKSLHSNRWKPSICFLCKLLVLSSLKTYDDIFRVLCCFGIFWTISDIVFKADILPTCDFFY